ncbi:MAG TPA: YraN family protein [Rhizobacter sp.]|nr:YraN family protein [Rhizobacter sp.]
MVTAGLTTKGTGDEAEAQALAHLTSQGLKLVQRNYRVAAGPRARGGEVDLIVRERDGTLVFVEVRARRNASHGGAAASVTLSKQRRVIYAAQHYLLQFASPPPCRFDVVTIEGGQLQWLRAAFSAD